MASAHVRRRVTSREFLTHPAASGPSELVRGEIRVMTPASGAHGLVAGEIFAALKAFADSHASGVCFPDNTGFELPGLADTVRSPDVAFILTDRLPREGIGGGWVNVAPDLVVEVVSPSETASELEDKLRDYRAAGTTVFWIVDPVTRTVRVRFGSLPEQSLTTSDAIDGGDLLPGFSIPVAKLFERLAR